MRFLGFFRGLIKREKKEESCFAIRAEPELKGHKDTQFLVISSFQFMGAQFPESENP